MNDLEELNLKIIGEANKLLITYDLLEIMGKYGVPVTTGSYVLELMTWRDLDCYLENDEITESRFFQLGAEIASHLKPQRMHFRNEFVGKTPGNPVGLYWGIYLTSHDFPEEWKIDIWAVDSTQAKKLQGDFEALMNRIDASKRLLILDIKNHFCKHPEYRRRFSSMDIYNTVIEGDVKSVEEFDRWLKKNRGIAVEENRG